MNTPLGTSITSDAPASFPPGLTLVTWTATDEAGNASTCTFTVTVDCGGKQVPGDCNQDGAPDISDAICLLGYLFLGAPTRLPCGDGSHLNPGNVTLLNWQPDGGVDLADVIGILSFLFQGEQPHPLDPGDRSCVPIEGCQDNPGCP